MMPSILRRPSLPVALVVGAALLAGCGESQPQVPFATRPGDIDVVMLDICATLTPGQLRKHDLGHGTPAEPRTSGPSQACSWEARDGGGLSLTMNADDANVWGASKLPGATLDSVKGYGVVRLADSSEIVSRCGLDIDASDNQSLHITFSSIHRLSDTPTPAQERDRLCRMASSAAADVIGNIRSSGN